LTPSSTTATANVSPKNIKIKPGTTVIWQNLLPEKVYVQSKPDASHSEGELLNGSYIFPGESREEKLNDVGSFIYDGSNGFGSYYVRGYISIVNETTQEKKIPIEIPTTQSKSKKSYQLIIYLDNASPQNTIGDNFKIIIYNSNNEPILSANPNIDFNDNHQKISPPKGYPIISRSGQHPGDIKVCAQQQYQVNGTNNLHNDCYPIKQNSQKTYWYTIFDYGNIDGADSNPIVKSNEMKPAKITTSKNQDSKSSDLKQLLSEATDFPGDDPNAVDVHVTSAKKDSIGDYHVIGEIKNLSQDPLTYVKVTAHFYDSDNQTVGITTCCYADPTDIEPNHTSTFDSFADSKEMLGTPKSFKLSFDWG